MLAAWQVFIRISALNMAGPGFTQLGAQATAAQTRVAKLQATMSAIQGTAALMGAALGAAFIKDGVEGAARLQVAMQSVQNATAATTAQVEQMRRLAFKVSGVTAQDVATIAEEMSIAARGGIGLGKGGKFDPAVMAALFPEIAKFADVQYLSPAHSDPSETTRLATQFVHYFKAYDQKKIALMLDQVNRVLQSQPEGLQQLVAQGKYFIPMATNLGVSYQDIAGYLAIMGQTGFLRGRGGTGMERVILGAIKATAEGSVTTFQQQKRLSALQELGMIGPDGKPSYVDDKGNLQLNALIGALDIARQKLGAIPFSSDVYKVFGAQGQQLLSTLVDPAVQEQFIRVKAHMASLSSIDKMQADYMKTFSGSWQMFITNLSNVSKAIFYPILPQLTVMFTGLAQALAVLGQFFTEHPITAELTAWATIISTIGLAIFGIVKLLAAARGFMAIAGIGSVTNPAFAGVFGGLGAAAGAVAGPIAVVLGIIAAIKLLNNLPDIYVHVSNWWALNKEKIAYNIGYAFGQITAYLVQGVVMMWQYVTAFAGSLFSNPAMMGAAVALASDNPAVAKQLWDLALQDASGRAGGFVTGSSGKLPHYIGKGFGAGQGNTWTSINRALRGPSGGGGFTLNVHTMNFGTTNDPKKHADAFLNEVNRRLPSALRSGSNSPGGFNFSPGTLGSLGTVHP
jgi:TP901 family phage tail tape measure protein